MIDTKYYPKAWFRVDFHIKEDSEVYIHFIAYKIKGLDEEVPANSEVEEKPCLKGFIKWDGCCEFDYGEHYCGLYAAEQFLETMREIYAYAQAYYGDRGLIESDLYLFKRNDV